MLGVINIDSEIEKMLQKPYFLESKSMTFPIIMAVDKINQLSILNKKYDIFFFSGGYANAKKHF